MAAKDEAGKAARDARGLYVRYLGDKGYTFQHVRTVHRPMKSKPVAIHALRASCGCLIPEGAPWSLDIQPCQFHKRQWDRAAVKPAKGKEC